jgi:hypothetical protein
MSSTRSHRTVTAVAVLVVTTGIAVTGSSVASAHRGVYDSGTCGESLTRIWDWPGEMETDSGRIVFFSDAYESYILRQPPCDVTRMPTPRWDPGQVGHQDPVGNVPAVPDVR